MNAAIRRRDGPQTHATVEAAADPVPGPAAVLTTGDARIRAARAPGGRLGLLTARFGAMFGDKAQRLAGWELALFLGVAACESLAALAGFWTLYPRVSWIGGLVLVARVLYGPAIYLYVLTMKAEAASRSRTALCLAVPQAFPVVVLTGLLMLPRQMTMWLRAVMILILVAWGWAMLHSLLQQVTPEVGWPDVLDATITLGSVGLLAYFGIRQRPPVLEADAASRRGPETEADKKYARSALDSGRMRKLGDRLEHLMRSESLHRDAALSLRGLAVKVGASPNYVSQTLNDHLGVSFFDFVNGFRVDEAEALLRETDRSVTDIAFDVGFNSRSTFNAAVRKHRGLAPTEMRHR